MDDFSPKLIALLCEICHVKHCKSWVLKAGLSISSWASFWSLCIKYCILFKIKIPVMLFKHHLFILIHSRSYYRLIFELVCLIACTMNSYGINIIKNETPCRILTSGMMLYYANICMKISLFDLVFVLKRKWNVIYFTNY